MALALVDSFQDALANGPRESRFVTKAWIRGGGTPGTYALTDSTGKSYAALPDTQGTAKALSALPCCTAAIAYRILHPGSISVFAVDTGRIWIGETPYYGAMSLSLAAAHADEHSCKALPPVLLPRWTGLSGPTEDGYALSSLRPGKLTGNAAVPGNDGCAPPVGEEAHGAQVYAEPWACPVMATGLMARLSTGKLILYTTDRTAVVPSSTQVPDLLGAGAGNFTLWADCRMAAQDWVSERYSLGANHCSGGWAGRLKEDCGALEALQGGALPPTPGPPDMLRALWWSLTHAAVKPFFLALGSTMDAEPPALAYKLYGEALLNNRAFYLGAAGIRGSARGAPCAPGDARGAPCPGLEEIARASEEAYSAALAAQEAAASLGPPGTRYYALQDFLRACGRPGDLPQGYMPRISDRAKLGPAGALEPRGVDVDALFRLAGPASDSPADPPPVNFAKVRLEYLVGHVLALWKLHRDAQIQRPFSLLLTNGYSLFRFQEEPGSQGELRMDYLVDTHKGYATNVGETPGGVAIAITLSGARTSRATITMSPENPYYFSPRPVHAEKYLVSDLKLLNASYLEWQTETAYTLGICPFTQRPLESAEEYVAGMSAEASKTYDYTKKLKPRGTSPAFYGGGGSRTWGSRAGSPTPGAPPGIPTSPKARAAWLIRPGGKE